MRTISVSNNLASRSVGLGQDDSHMEYLEKQSPSILKLWQKRFFVLGHRMIKYYKTHADFNQGQPPRGVINFEQVCVDYEFKDIQQRIDLKIRGSNRVF